MHNNLDSEIMQLKADLMVRKILQKNIIHLFQEQVTLKYQVLSKKN